MNAAVILVSVSLLLGAYDFLPARAVHALNETGSAIQQPLRVAIVGFQHSKANGQPPALEARLADALARDSRALVIDQSLIEPAVKGIGYAGSINLSKTEARRLGAAIGCDFFIIGKTETLARSEREKESHQEAYAGVMIVAARTGALIAFDFVAEKASTSEAASRALENALAGRATSYIDLMTRPSIGKSFTVPSQNTGLPRAEVIEAIPDEGSPRAEGFRPPEFLNRVRPDYTAEAELADITATVEASVVFRANGEIGSIEIKQWAGFGLDESSERAIRQLKFKPATRDGRPISVRALIRYNFRRLSEGMALPEPPALKPPDKPERDLRQLFKPTYRRP